MTTTMILCFFVTTIPSSLVPILYPNRHPLDLRYQTFRVCSAIIELNNYAIYILIYLVCSTEFRRELLRFLQVKILQIKCFFINDFHYKIDKM